MPLNESKGNMYDFVTHTFNAIKGQCYHDCSYCYMKKWGKQKPVRFDEKELNTDLGSGNFIFVGSSCDMFAEDIPEEWITKTLDHCNKFDNKYFLQTKNPERYLNLVYKCKITDKFSFCTTIESNRIPEEIMGRAPHPLYRSNMGIYDFIDKYVTIEPIMDFDLYTLLTIIKDCNPIQVNIGADSGNNNLPEPPKDKILELISELEKFTIVNQKKNLKRLLT